jgi:hypothetical protein
MRQYHVTSKLRTGSKQEVLRLAEQWGCVNFSSRRAAVVDFDRSKWDPANQERANVLHAEMQQPAVRRDVIIYRDQTADKFNRRSDNYTLAWVA